MEMETYKERQWRMQEKEKVDKKHTCFVVVAFDDK